METQTVVWIELTSPWEENRDKNRELKIIRYNQLAIDLREGKHVGNIKWRVIPLYVKVGCRGTVNQRPWYGICNDLGFTQTITRRITQTITRRITEAATQTALWCSYFVFLFRFVKVWELRPLMGASVWKGTR